MRIIAKIVRHLRSKLLHLLSEDELKKVVRIGKQARVTESLSIRGGEYISIGDQFYGGPGCRIEAWDSFKDFQYTPQISIGDRVKINSRCHIGAINSIVAV
ncbi:hypothetical protein LOX54_08905 [Latilactobacillus curvatus]|uniref:hypothetical protein n=1 Tax=Latilactobacillus curvatus TaxID=28038 RepID=UPI0020C7715F|nr:hypothetical protein [Latilactobacillus curvatus]MCP8862021.1 hypothetical protein [Latilactobacillus curvatus]MCP8869192.1 hypothetical protein [Latilactobacillus curvatus]MCP8872734.1 hypothetical protein [Latilactobacillus curvatus]MCP8881763.1 hypothetical protein [Latilactobacillus curvatus]